MIPEYREPSQPLVSKTVTATLDIDYTTLPRHITHVLQIDVCNNTAVDRWVSILLRGKYLLNQKKIVAHDNYTWNGVHALLAGDTIQTQAEVGSAIDVLISGIHKHVST
jgi:hypothetical protein